MSISPSRVRSSTVPISRMYIRTGSVVRPISLSTLESAAAAASAGNANRPVASDYIQAIFDDFMEFSGDRYYKDDGAVIGGI